MSFIVTLVLPWVPVLVNETFSVDGSVMESPSTPLGEEVVTILIDGVPVGATMTNWEGRFSFETAVDTSGMHTIQAKATILGYGDVYSLTEAISISEPEPEPEPEASEFPVKQVAAGLAGLITLGVIFTKAQRG